MTTTPPPPLPYDSRRGGPGKTTTTPLMAGVIAKRKREQEAASESPMSTPQASAADTGLATRDLGERIDPYVNPHEEFYRDSGEDKEA